MAKLSEDIIQKELAHVDKKYKEVTEQRETLWKKMEELGQTLSDINAQRILWRSLKAVGGQALHVQVAFAKCLAEESGVELSNPEESIREIVSKYVKQDRESATAPVATATTTASEVSGETKRRGRPKGSKNKPKDDAVDPEVVSDLSEIDRLPMAEPVDEEDYED